MLVYGSMVIDAAIMAIMFLAASSVINPTSILFGVNTLLAIVVALSGVIAVLFLLAKNYDRVIRWALVTQHRAKVVTSKFSNLMYKALVPPKYRYRRLRFKIYELLAEGAVVGAVSFVDGMTALGEAVGLLRAEDSVERDWRRQKAKSYLDVGK